MNINLQHMMVGFMAAVVVLSFMYLQMTILQDGKEKACINFGYEFSSVETIYQDGVCYIHNQEAYVPIAQ